MKEFSKATNVLLAIIAVCLIVIAIKPVGVVPDAAAQMRPLDERDTSSAQRFTRITAAETSVKEQVDAIRSVATAIEALAKATEQVAESIRDVGNAVAEGRSSATEPQSSTVTPRIRIQ